MRRDLIPHGDVDERSIEDVHPDDLQGYHQHHFFAGIGGWPYALRIAGWSDDRPVWTGSCPCQPFSQAGQRAGFADQRHLWPAWHWLVEQCRPDTIFGEQVGRRLGAEWLDLVFSDLEVLGYACGATALPACSVGAPHIRERLFWVANVRVEHPGSQRLSPCQQDVLSRSWGRQERGTAQQPGGSCIWEPCEWIVCRDGRSRPVEPGIRPLAHGIPCRVGTLRGYGNAIVPNSRRGS
ncbi:DNA cytosine methyltransferase [Candidatus Magnetaquiglobus chichijimensis]|uniref:DNA cytosine methyltransferase n=1 Tax=Candidatus Magnetaquiglobus chichijimensis TaxID=3141448 RepID=UPI003B9728DE